MEFFKHLANPSFVIIVTYLNYVTGEKKNGKSLQEYINLSIGASRWKLSIHFKSECIFKKLDYFDFYCVCIKRICNGTKFILLLVAIPEYFPNDREYIYSRKNFDIYDSIGFKA